MCRLFVVLKRKVSCSQLFAYAKIYSMNEDGSTGMPNNPVFSSPNISSGDDSSNDTNQIDSQTITSQDIAAMAGTAAGDVVAAAAAMPENDAKTAITSSTTPSSASSTSHLFSNRKFKDSQNTSAPTRFAGAPDFFNEAVADQSGDYISIGNSDPAPRSSNKGRLIIIGALVAAIAIIAKVSLVLPSAVGNIAKSNDIKKLKESWSKLDCAIMKAGESCDDLANSTYAGLTKVDPDTKEIDYQYYYDAITTFQSDIEDISNELALKKEAMDSSERLWGYIVAIGNYEYFVKNFNQTAIDAVINHNNAKETADTFVGSISDNNYIAAIQKKEKDFIIKKISLLSIYYERGCNTEEMLDVESECMDSVVTSQEEDRISEIASLRSTIEVRINVYKSAIGTTLKETREELNEDNN
jgi:hypothetical protein